MSCGHVSSTRSMIRSSSVVSRLSTLITLHDQCLLGVPVPGQGRSPLRFGQVASCAAASTGAAWRGPTRLMICGTPIVRRGS